MTVGNSGLEYFLKSVAKSESAAIICHINPDGDALGSSFALGLALRALGKRAAFFCDDGTPAFYDFLPLSGELRRADTGHDYDLVIVVDCADMARLGSCSKLLNKAKDICWIDHHVNSDGLKYEGGVVNSEASSAGEMVFELIKALGVTIDRPIAMCLYTAVSNDTGNFRYSNTTAETLRCAAELLDAGVDVAEMGELLMSRRPLAKTRLIAHAIESMELYCEDRLAVMTASRELLRENEAMRGDVEGVIDFARDVEGVILAVFIRERSGGVKVSMRSKSEGPDVQVLCEVHGGGGHVRAAGCSLDGVTLEEAKDILIRQTSEALEKL